MTRGKSICKVLRTIRTQVAQANEIKYEPHECHHQGECRGTCPACEAEMRYIEQQLDMRRLLGKAVTIVGISAGLSALSGCSDKGKKVEDEKLASLTEGKVEVRRISQYKGDVEYRSPVDSVIVEERKATAKIRTAEFKVPKKAETVSAVDTIPSQEQLDQNDKRPEVLFGDVVEQMPSFPGGTQALMEYLQENVVYPEETCAQGRVVITFVVEKDGSITEAKVVKSVEPALDEEALRIVNAMPKWIPGSQNGERVRTKFAVPVFFRLQ